jgi:hypothetical protein
MVLLTSSSISVAISSGVVCLFTFLLFLSGYVVQQQTVRSLQAALHPPPMPTPTLPIYFQKGHENERAETVNTTDILGASEIEVQGEKSEKTQLLGFRTIIRTDAEPTLLPPSKVQLEDQSPWPNEPSPETSSTEQSTKHTVNGDEKVESTAEEPTAVAPPEPESSPAPPARIAYVQLLSSPSQICSALLFFKFQKDYGDADIGRFVLYPLLWEEDTSSDAFTSALALMRLVKDEYNIIYRAIKIEDTSDEQSIERELVGHLAADDWEYAHMMYLRSPGLALNVAALDSALQASRTKPLLSRSWARAIPEPSTAPSVLLVSHQEIYMPRGSNRRLTAEAITSHSNHHETEMDVEAAARTAAYVHFEEGELEHRRTEKEWYGGVFERYERGRAEICKGIDFSGGETELRKVRRKTWR